MKTVNNEILNGMLEIIETTLDLIDEVLLEDSEQEFTDRVQIEIEELRKRLNIDKEKDNKENTENDSEENPETEYY